MWPILKKMRHTIRFSSRTNCRGTTYLQYELMILFNSFKLAARNLQGYVLSPLLFDVYIEYMVRSVSVNWAGEKEVEGRKIHNLRYTRYWLHPIEN